MASITLTADRRSVKKGESFSVSWTSNTPDSLVLVIDDGDSVQRIQVPDSGTRICWSNRAAADIKITLISVSEGKKETKSVKVKVKAGKVNASSGIGKFQMAREKTQAWFSVTCAQFRYAWGSMKKWQRMLWIAMLALPIVMIIIGLIK